MKYNKYIECIIGNQKVKAKLLSVSVNQLILSIPASIIDFHVDTEFSTKLFFQTYQFSVKGKAVKIIDKNNNYIKVQYSINFSPELVDILNEYFIRYDIDSF